MAPAYHWARKQSPFRLRVGDNVAGDWNAYLRAALDDWNQNETVRLVEVDGATNPQSCQPVTGRVEVCDWRYGTQTGWLGLTQLYFSGDGEHIDAATVQFNDSFLYAPNSPYNSDAARRHTICHELGHTMGLAHVTTASCMNNSQEAVFNNLTPISDDFEALRQLYAHQDATRTVAQAAEPDLSLFAPASAPEVDSDEDVMAFPLGEGTTVLTFITWAAETVPAEATAGTDVVPETGLAADNSADGLEGEVGLDSATADTDTDGVSDRDELTLYRTNPTLPDTDGDGALDGAELFGSHTDPLLSDNARTSSGVLAAETSPPPSAPESVPEAVATSIDRDADNYPDAAERAMGLDPGNPDTDGDAVADGDELNIYGTDPFTWDTDGDGRSDGEELFATGTDPLVGDTTGAGP
jgi:hypothetical protein